MGFGPDQYLESFHRTGITRKELEQAKKYPTESCETDLYEYYKKRVGQEADLVLKDQPGVTLKRTIEEVRPSSVVVAEPVAPPKSGGNVGSQYRNVTYFWMDLRLPPGAD